MYTLTNQVFNVLINEKGLIDSLSINQDNSKMNWVINESYLKEHHYPDYEKLFGNFSLMVDDHTYYNQKANKRLEQSNQQFKVYFDFAEAGFSIEYIIQQLILVILIGKYRLSTILRRN